MDPPESIRAHSTRGISSSTAWQWRNDSGRHLHCSSLVFPLFFHPFLSTACLPFLHDSLCWGFCQSDWCRVILLCALPPACRHMESCLFPPTLFLAGLLQCVTVSPLPHSSRIYYPKTWSRHRMLHILLCCATQAHMGLCDASLRMTQ